MEENAAIGVFISHSQEDTNIALEIALGLEKVELSTWLYELDSIPGLSYLIQTGKAIENASAIILIISPESVQSFQVSKEVVRGHESGKHFIPILKNITHKKFQEIQPEWREALGAATSIQILSVGIHGVLPKIIKGLQALMGQQAKIPNAKRIAELKEMIEQGTENLISKKEQSSINTDFLDPEITLLVCSHGVEEKILVYDENEINQIIIGRADDCHVQIKAAFSSSHHAMIFHEEGTGWMIKDLNSKNGTFLNGQRITESKIKPYDEVLIGSTRIFIRSSIKDYENIANKI